MGGYWSGGHNREKDYVGKSIRIDSYNYSKYIQLLNKHGKDCYKGSSSWSGGSSIGYELFTDKLVIGYTLTSGADKESIRDTFYFNSVPNNYGGANRLYFLCLYCGCRSRFLYLSRKHFRCRKCANLNYISQQTTKNHDLAAYKMKRFIRDKFKVTESLAPINAVHYRPERPKGMHHKTYQNLLHQLYHLQKEYGEKCTAAVTRITGRFL